jgi:acylphosphatase
MPSTRLLGCPRTSPICCIYIALHPRYSYRGYYRNSAARFRRVWSREVVVVMRPPFLKERGSNRRSNIVWKLVIQLGSILAVVGTILLATRSPKSIDMLASLRKDNRNSDSGFRFEIEGKVQNVSFRKYSQRQARNIGDIVGWIRNTARGTVEGELASRSSEKRQQMQEWLRTTGSPRSVIQRATFDELTPVQAKQLMETLKDFSIEKTTGRN